MRKFLFLLLIFLSISIPTLFSQSDTTLQLRSKLANAQEDSNLVDLYIRAATTYRFTNTDSSFYFINKAIDLSEKLSLKRALVGAYRTKGILYIINSKLDSAIAIYNIAIPIAKANELDESLIKIYINLGIAYSQKGDFTQAEKNYFTALNDYSKSLSTERESVIYNNLGLMYLGKGEYLDAMESQQKALQIREELKDTLGMASSYLNIANINFYQSEYYQAIDYYKQALAIYEAKNIAYGKGQCYHNLGTIFQKVDSLDIAKIYLEKALNSESAKTSRGKAMALNMLGLVSLKQENYNEAKNYFNQSLEIQRKIDSKSQIIPTLNNLADLYNKISQPKTSLHYSQEALNLTKTTGAREYEKDVYLNLSNSYELTNDYKRSVGYFKKYTTLKDSLFNKEKHQQIKELEIKYQSSQIEKELNIQKAELLKNKLVAKQKDASIKNEKIQKYAAMSIMIILSIFIIVIIYNHKQKRKAALLLLEKNEELNNQKITDLILNHRLESAKSAMEAQQKERIRIAQELHDGVGGSLAAVKLFVDSMRKTQNTEELQIIYDNINSTYEEVRSISHNLTPPKFEFASITDIVKDYITQISQHSKIEIILSAKPSLGWNELNESIQINIYRIAQELVNNIIKHANATKIEFSLELIDNTIKMSIIDNGVGFDINKKASGIGLQNIKNRINELQGECKIESEKAKGTSIYLSIPLN